MYKISEERYQLLEKYYIENGDLMPSKGVMYQGIDIYSFLNEFKKKYNRKIMDSASVQRLENIGMIWNLNEYRWGIFYKAVEEYYNKFGNIDIPLRYENQDGLRIGKWLQIQRINYAKMCEDNSNSSFTRTHTDKLEKLGMVWNPLEEQWGAHYELAKEYYDQKGSLLVPIDYITDNGFKLGNWIANQRKYYRLIDSDKHNPSFTDDRIKKLEAIGMVWYPHQYIKQQTELKVVEKRRRSEHKKKDKKETIWNKYYKEAVIYYNKKGDLFVPNKFASNGIGLGAWIGNQRRKYKNHQLNQDEITQLEVIGMVWDVYEVSWQICYKYAQEYYAEKGNLSIPYNYIIDEVNLGTWINNQRNNYKKSKLDESKVVLLEKLSIMWNVEEELWEARYDLLKQYKEQNGDVLVPMGYIIEDVNLYSWISTQRKNKKNGQLDELKIQRLDLLGISWDPLDDKWNRAYKLAKRYYEKYGDLLIPIAYEAEDIKVGSWVATQRQNYKRKNGKRSNPFFTPYRIELLEKIGMVWSLPANYNKTSFEEQCAYYYVKKYFPETINNYREFGMELDIYIPNISTAIEYDGEYWHKRKFAKDSYKNDECKKNDILLIRIREPKCSNIDGEYIEYKLEDNSNNTLQKTLIRMFKEQFNIDADIDIIRNMDYIMDQCYARIKDSWNEKYELAKQYYVENGNLLIPYEYEVSGINLGAWIGTQRQAYKGIGKSRITQNHIDLLEQINMIWDVKLAVWEEKYLLAVQYFVKHGNLKVPHSYVVDGVQLGRWIETQRQAYKEKHYKITDEQIRKLEKIQMIWKK